MSPETKEKFQQAIEVLMGDTPLPDNLKIEDVAEQMEKFYNRVITHANKMGTDDMFKFFMTFFAGYLCGYCANSVQKGKHPWEWATKRN